MNYILSVGAHVYRKCRDACMGIWRNFLIIVVSGKWWPWKRSLDMWGSWKAPPGLIVLDILSQVAVHFTFLYVLFFSGFFLMGLKFVIKANRTKKWKPGLFICHSGVVWKCADWRLRAVEAVGQGPSQEQVFREEGWALAAPMGVSMGSQCSLSPLLVPRWPCWTLVQAENLGRSSQTIISRWGVPLTLESLQVQGLTQILKQRGKKEK